MRPFLGTLKDTIRHECLLELLIRLQVLIERQIGWAGGAGEWLWIFPKDPRLPIIPLSRGGQQTYLWLGRIRTNGVADTIVFQRFLGHRAPLAGVPGLRCRPDWAPPSSEFSADSGTLNRVRKNVSCLFGRSVARRLRTDDHRWCGLPDVCARAVVESSITL